ncbi:uncharacterized protein E0L32_011216 [Thyridium curvatum]|uniref:Uncharacterized protein n=1 Tax=Thyridium curvatum TaxID=1093900 RepID=A0A507BHZ9_9PEZI|nr:uncharacterized protein E0L32_011216 [Thyridium curvatum]TPX19143.1 hypothetical protein E0L32_011216 [Thyridium curvatum]
MTAPPAPLTEAEKAHFLEHGWIKLSNCFTKEQADHMTRDVWTRLGMDPHDKSTWTKKRVNMPMHWDYNSNDFAPKAWAAICELCGGEDRVADFSRRWRDSYIVNLGSPEGEGKIVPPHDLDGWHVDGDFFIHYLDSPEQALLVIPLFTDIVPNAGGTLICPEAIPKVAKHLYEHPEGVDPSMRTRDNPHFGVVDFRQTVSWFDQLARTCEHFVEVTGNVGDVFLLHPLMLHAVANNTLRHVRIITNPPVALKQPHCFDRPDGDFSLVERKTMLALGGEDKTKGWKATGPREKITPKMWKAKEEMKQEEIRRLDAARKVQVAA